MKVTFDYLPEFERRAKSLARKYKSFSEDYDIFLNELEKNPFCGESLGHHTYKHRMTITAKGKGKSGGARVITYNVKHNFPEDDVLIILMSIYDKNEISNVSDNYLRSLIQAIEESRK